MPLMLSQACRGLAGGKHLLVMYINTLWLECVYSTIHVKNFKAEKFRRWPWKYKTFPPKLLLHIHVCKVSKDSL